MKVLVAVAHPDDETFGCGSVIARAVREGHEVVVCCATRGEAGEPIPGSVPEDATLAEVREAELHEAAGFLGVAELRLLSFQDSGWDGPASIGTLCGAPMTDVVDEMVAVLDAVRPDVVVTLDPGGGDGHRDHVRIAEATTVAFDHVAGNGEMPAGARLYYWCLVRSVMQQWLAYNRGSVYDAGSDDEVGCPDEQITTVVDVSDLLPLRLEAIRHHRSQTSPYDGLPDDLVAGFLASDRLIRARPPWTGGAVETSMFGSAES